MSEVLTKVCSKCKKELELSFFYKHKNCKYGVTSWCKSCQLECNKKWRKNNPEKHKESNLKWRKNNPEKYKESHLKWYKNNPEKCRLINLKWNKNNPIKRKELNRKFEKKAREILSDKIVKSDLCHMGIPRENITPELIEQKRELLKMHRLIKKAKSIIKDKLNK